MPYRELSKYILHPTDFAPESELAFCHALRLAMDNHARLKLLHAEGHAKRDWDRFPSVRETLEKWGRLPAGAPREAVSDLGLTIEKFVYDDRDFVHAISEYLQMHQVDMLVLSTHGRHGLASLVRPSSAERAARVSKIQTLFVPNDCRGCVSMDSGDVTMQQVLIPVDHDPPAEAAIERGLQAIQAYGHNQATLNLLHVGSELNFPEVYIPDDAYSVQRIVRDGNPVNAILNVAEEIQANLLIMVTKGTEGFVDALRGTTTEQVLRKSPCPVLSVPAQY